MYFFDIVDYYNTRIIGNQYVNIPICDTRWSDMGVVAAQTADAYFKSLSEWYSCGTACLVDGECKDAILAMWATVLDDRNQYVIKADDFFYMMGEECSTGGVYNPTIYDDFISIQQKLLCDVEELTYLVDGLVQ